MAVEKEGSKGIEGMVGEVAGREEGEEKKVAGIVRGREEFLETMQNLE